MKDKINTFIENNSEEYIKLADFIFDNPELGLNEFKAIDKITTILKRLDFHIEKNIYGYETAFRAKFKNKNGKIKIGLLCEYDALEGLGHACSHHLQAPCILLCAMAIKETCKDYDYELVIYGTPAEETLGAKIYMEKAGAFSDIDIAFMMHGADATCVDVKSMALINLDVEFFGVSSHAALKPENGKSALDAMLLAFHGLEILREHVKDDTRMHFALTDTPKSANVVPNYTKARFSLRSYDSDYLQNIVKDKFYNLIKGAAIMLGVDYKIEVVKTLNGKIPVYSLNELVMQNAKFINAPQITQPREKTGSTDFGNVTYKVPGTCIRIAFVPKGSSSHSQIFLDYGKSDEAHEAIKNAAKILACSIYDILSDEEKLNEIKGEFEQYKSSNRI